MKVAIVITRFLPKWLGGAEIATSGAAEHLAQRGHEVHVITTLDPGLPNESVENGVYLHRLFCPHLRHIDEATFYAKVLQTTRSVKPDILFIQDVGQGLHGFFSKRLFKTPYVIQSHGYAFHQSRRWRYVASVVLRDADAVIALNDDMKKELQRIWMREIAVIPNAISSEMFPNISRDVARERLEIEASEKVILCISRWDVVKGLPFLIEGVNHLKLTEPNARLLLVGYGPEEDKLKLLVNKLGLSDRVSFVGKVQQTDIPTYTAASDVFVLPSLTEGFGNVLLEAMAAALPIVATCVGGIPSLVEDGVNGFLVHPRNAGQIADKISFILNNAEIRQLMAANNRKKALHYTWQNVVEREEKLLLQCLKAT
jgi:glycosyltransferase involved in cell wall biosynthesis